MPPAASYGNVSVQSDDDIKSVGTRAYDATDVAVRELEEIPGAGVEIDVREGTLSVAGLIVAGAAALYVAITAYDGFWSGVERIRGHAIRVGSLLRSRFQRDPLVGSGPILSTRVTAGHLDRLHKLHGDVLAGRLTADQAVQEVLKT